MLYVALGKDYDGLRCYGDEKSCLSDIFTRKGRFEVLRRNSGIDYPREQVKRGRSMSTRMNRADFTVLHVINGMFVVVRSHAGHLKRAQAVTITQGVV